MPIAILHSNLSKEKFGPAFRQAFLTLLSASLKKPEEGIAILINAGAECTYGTTDNPCVLLNLKSIGRLEPEQNIAHTSAITEFLIEQIGVPKKQVLIHFEDLKPHEVGYHGTTVQALRQN